MGRPKRPNIPTGRVFRGFEPPERVTYPRTAYIGSVTHRRTRTDRSGADAALDRLADGVHGSLTQPEKPFGRGPRAVAHAQDEDHVAVEQRVGRPDADRQGV